MSPFDARLVDPGDHPRLGRRDPGSAAGESSASSRERLAVGRIDGDAADLGGERPDLDPELGQERPGDAAGRDPGGRLARRGPLEDVADVVEAVLQGAGQVGVAGPHAGDRRRPLVALVGGRGELAASASLERLDLHDLGPVLPVAVADQEQDRRAEGQAVADAGQDLGAVVLDRLARAAAVAALAAGEVDGELRRRSGRGRPARPRSSPPAPGRAIRRRSGTGSRPTTRASPTSVSGRGAATGAAPVGSPSADSMPPARAVVERLPPSPRAGPAGRSTGVNAAAPWWSSISSPFGDGRAVRPRRRAAAASGGRSGRARAGRAG